MDRDIFGQWWVLVLVSLGQVNAIDRAEVDGKPKTLQKDEQMDCDHRPLIVETDARDQAEVRGMFWE